MSQLNWWESPAPSISQTCLKQAQQRQDQLTKPPGSLGRLESIATQLAAIQHRGTPGVDKVFIAIFAGDHGIAEEGISAFPQLVTVEMQRNFVNGGAAISVLARQLNAELEIINTGTHADPDELNGVTHLPIAKQTQNFKDQPAMDTNQWRQAMGVGKKIVEQAQQKQIELFIGGEMGIGNTASASAVLSALCDIPVENITGPGTGLNASGVNHKVAILQQALEHHRPNLTNPMEIARRLGGFEIVALAGAYLAAAQNAMAVLVDGFICSAAAAIAMKLNPSIEPYLFFSHCSAEPGHKLVMSSLGVSPLVDLNLRLGEASGAAVVVPLLRSACALHNEMATFAQAEVSNKS